MAKWKNVSDFSDSSPKWDYEEDPIIEGALTQKRLDVSAKKLCFYDIEKKGGETFSVLGNVVINRSLKDVPVGTVVRIEYLGLATNKEGTSFKNYKVDIDEDSIPTDNIVEELKKQAEA